MKTIVGMFETQEDARSALADFAKIGLQPERIGLLSPAGTGSSIGGMSMLDLPDIGPVMANRPMIDLLSRAQERGDGGVSGALQRMGLSKSEADRYVEGVKRGGTLEALTVSDEREAEVSSIMRRSFGREPEAARELVIPLVEEELSVGKCEIDAGGVRISTHVSTRPVDKTVTLIEEHVKVERRVVDRPIDGSDDPFREESIAMKISAEEPLISKRAHVVEEIHVRKDRTERTETVRDSLRRTDVDISELPGTQRASASHYRAHFESTYGSSGGSYESFAPAYEFGERLRKHSPGDDWSVVEPRAKAMWAERQGGAWERFRDAIKFAWERARH